MVSDFPDGVLDVFFVGLKGVIFKLFIDADIAVLVVLNVSVRGFSFPLFLSRLLIVTLNFDHLRSASRQKYI